MFFIPEFYNLCEAKNEMKLSIQIQISVLFPFTVFLATKQSIKETVMKDITARIASIWLHGKFGFFNFLLGTKKTKRLPSFPIFLNNQTKQYKKYQEQSMKSSKRISPTNVSDIQIQISVFFPFTVFLATKQSIEENVMKDITARIASIWLHGKFWFFNFLLGTKKTKRLPHSHFS